MKKKEINNLPKEINNESTNTDGLTVPIHKDYFEYFGVVKQNDDIYNIDTEVEEIGYNTPYSLIYNDNLQNRCNIKNTNYIDKLTNFINQDRFLQMISCCINGFMNSFIGMVMYEFEQKGISKEYLSTLLSSDGYSKLLSEFMITIYDFSFEDENIFRNVNTFAINLIKTNDLDQLMVYFNTFINYHIANVYDVMHNYIIRELFGIDPNIIVELFNILTNCIIIYHDTLNFSIIRFLEDLCNNPEFIAANISAIKGDK